jgi:hypothetical protein
VHDRHRRMTLLAAFVVVIAGGCTSSTDATPTTSVSTTVAEPTATTAPAPTTSTSTTTTTLPPAPTLTDYLIGVIEAAGEADIADATTALALGTEQAYRDAVAAIAEQRRRIAALEPPEEAVEFHGSTLELASSQIELLTAMADAIAVQDYDSLGLLSEDAIGLGAVELEVATAQAELIASALGDIETPTSAYLQEALISGQQMRTDLAQVFADLQLLLAGDFPGLDALTAVLEDEAAILEAASSVWNGLAPTPAAVSYHAEQGSLIDGGAAQVQAMLAAVAADDPSAFGDALRASTANFQRSGDITTLQAELILDVLRGTVDESVQALTLVPLSGSFPVGSLAAGEDRLVGAGFSSIGISTHGLYWTEPLQIQSERREEMSTFETFTRRSVASTLDGEFVVLGTITDLDGGDEFAAWTSNDGQQWDRVDLGSAATRVERGAAIVAVASSEIGLVAVGCDCDLAESKPVVWFTADGSTWRRADLEGGDTGVPDAIAVAATDTGFSAIIGADAWVSSDGRVWELIEPSPFSSDADVVIVARFGEGFIAGGSVGSGSDQRAAVWTSADGRSWESDDGETIGSPGTTVAAIAEYGGGLVAVGSDRSGAKMIPAAWISADGSTWDRIELSLAPPMERGAQQFVSVHVGGPGVIVSGLDDERPMVWVGYPTG